MKQIINVSILVVAENIFTQNQMQIIKIYLQLPINSCLVKIV